MNGLVLLTKYGAIDNAKMLEISTTSLWMNVKTDADLLKDAQLLIVDQNGPENLKDAFFELALYLLHLLNGIT